MSIEPRVDRRIVGFRGEQFAADYLERALGWRILDRNWRCRTGELDIIGVDDQALVAVEVRSRTGHRLGRPVESVNHVKTSRLFRLTSIWLATHSSSEWSGENQYGCAQPAWEFVRIDVIGLQWHLDTVTDLVHIRGAERT